MFGQSAVSKFHKPTLCHHKMSEVPPTISLSQMVFSYIHTYTATYILRECMLVCRNVKLGLWTSFVEGIFELSFITSPSSLCKWSREHNRKGHTGVGNKFIEYLESTCGAVVSNLVYDAWLCSLLLLKITTFSTWISWIEYRLQASHEPSFCCPALHFSLCCCQSLKCFVIFVLKYDFLRHSKEIVQRVAKGSTSFLRFHLLSNYFFYSLSLK